jgi:acyl-CoA synthetase (AMP-forming)/AMP-acid ligase II
MHTGDAGYMNDGGYMFIVDRIKEMILSEGENVLRRGGECSRQAHPAVRLAAVVGIPGELLGERVHVFVVRRSGRHVTSDELRAFCRARIAAYKTPRAVEFAASLPVSGAGKILKHALRANIVGAAH